MLSFFRRIIKSRLGIPITLAVLGMIALAFAAGDINNVRSGSNVGTGGIVNVGGTVISEPDMRRRVQTAFAGYRQQQPTLDMATFVGQGGFDAVIDRTINALALREFGESIGMVASKRAVDGEIASIPGFQGFDGKFNQTAYEGALKQNGLTDKSLRSDLARDILARQLMAPTAGASQMPVQLALPYASLLLERRAGSVGVIPVAALGVGTPPSDAELTAFFARNRARYTVPERRVVRYALVKAADITAGAKPTEGEIAQAYAQNRARFAPSEKRSITQVVLVDQSAAAALAAKVKSGTAIADAARAVGLEAATISGADRVGIAAQTTPAIASAVFGATSGAVIGPLKSPLGWHVARVEAIQAIPGKSLAQATPELTAELGKSKGQEALAAIHDKLDDAISGSATFDEVMADAKLTGLATRPILANGVDPATPAAKPDPMLARIAQAAFGAEPGDSPQLVQIDADGSFAVVGVGQVLPAAPPPLVMIRDVVARDLVIDRNLKAARSLAIAAVAKIDRGVPLATALAQTGLKLPPVQTLNATRAELAQQSGKLPPPLALMFSMAPKRAKMLEAPNRGGWFIVYLDAIQEGDARGNAALIASARQGLGSASGREFSEQFAGAVRAKVGVKRNEAAITKLRGDLSGGGAN